MSENEQPTTEELAKELAATEPEASETAPDSAPEETPEAEAPADTPAPDPPAPDPEADPEPEPDKTIAPPVKSAAQADKKKADGARRKKVIADSAIADLPVDEEEEKRKAGIYDELEAVQAELEEALAAVESCKGRARDLMAELYPHTTGSDKLVVAVRGYVASQKKIRANRASSPARIAEILKAAGRSPIDQAFQVQRARGMSRPTRTPAPAPAKTGDQGDGSNANAGSE